MLRKKVQFKKSLLNIALLLFSLLIHCPLLAEEEQVQQSATFGDVANNMMGSVLVFYSVIQTVYLLTGLAFVTTSLIKYYEHRINPLGVTLSHVLFLFIVGVVLVSFPYFLNHHYDVLNFFTT